MASILIIDDDEEVCEILSRILGRESHEVSATYDGEEGLRRVSEGGIDLILVDIFMPTKSGLEIIQEVSKKHPETRIIAMTAFGAQEDVDLRSIAVRYGATGFLEKPFDHARVIETVKEVLAA